ncbi:MAG: response regulator [Verrucomicrobiota bacterium]
MASVLLIDDNDPLRELMSLALAREGHQVWNASNSKDGIDLLRQHTIDLLITDIVMPDKDGLETMQLARKVRPDLRVIVISGDSPRHAPLYLGIASKLGANKTLMKPFAITTLHAAVNELCPPAQTPPPVPPDQSPSPAA